MRLYEKVRPPTLDAVVGHEKAKKQIACAMRSGLGGKAFWISGPSGTGKTTLGKIIAGTIADPFFIDEYDSADVVTADALNDIQYHMSFYAGGKGGRAYIINEAHALRGVIVRRLLGILERVPNHVVFVFTTTVAGQKHLFDNQIDASPLLSRCIKIELFATPAFGRQIAERCRQIAQAEGLDGKGIEEYMALAFRCNNNMRAMLQAVESGEMLA
jgi:replication-associated recombination protein RarA